jgi:hypothetical protein
MRVRIEIPLEAEPKAVCDLIARITQKTVRAIDNQRPMTVRIEEATLDDVVKLRKNGIDAARLSR